MPVPYKRATVENTRFSSQRSSHIPLPVKQPVPKGLTGISHASKPSINTIPLITPAKELRLARKPLALPMRDKNSQDKKPNKTVNPEISSEVAILDLIPFARQPTVDFNEVPINSVAIKYVAMRNTLDVEQQLFVKVFPKFEKGFNIDATEFLLAPRTEIFVALSWAPTALGNMRETITFQDINRHPKRIVLTGCAVPAKSTIKSIPRICVKRNPRISPCKLNRMIKQDSRPVTKPPSKPLTNLIFASKRRQSAQIVKKILSQRDDVVATQVQSYFRMIISQRELVHLREQKALQIKTNAALLIQARWRGSSLRRRFIALKNASIVLQSHWKSRLVRKELQRLKEISQARTSAATIIQSGWRGLIQRKRYISLKIASIKLQSCWRSRNARLELKQLKESFQSRRNAAILIQSRWRGSLQRKRYLALKTASIILQTYWRARVAKIEFKQLQEISRARTDAAKLIQSLWRGYVLRKKYIAIRNASIGIQTYWRSKLARKEYQRLLEDLKIKTNAATLIQSHWRCLLQRKRYVALKDASIVLQSHWRSRVARKELHRLKLLKRTSIGLQTYCRGYLTRCRLKKSIEALNRIQSGFFERKATLC